jgi:hypothetical protein
MSFFTHESLDDLKLYYTIVCRFDRSGSGEHGAPYDHLREKAVQLRTERHDHRQIAERLNSQTILLIDQRFLFFTGKRKRSKTTTTMQGKFAKLRCRVPTGLGKHEPKT